MVLASVKMKIFRIRKYRMVQVLILTVAVLFLLRSSDSLYVKVYQIIADNFDVFYFYQTNRPHFCCVDFKGGLGNLLFQYSFIYVMAKTMNLTLVVEKQFLDVLQEAFQIPNVTFNVRGARVCLSKTAFRDSIDVGYDKSLIKFPNDTDLHFDGYFQSWRYWAGYEDDLRRQIKFHPWILQEAEKLLSEALVLKGKSKYQVTLVGIHVRRGDIITNEHFMNYGYQVPEKDYFKKAMEHIRSLVKGEILFIICSNDMNWTKNAISVNNTVFINSTKREYDMAVLTLCDHLIMSVGTFGWWTGFLSKGTVIYYNTPFRPNTGLARNWAKDYTTSFFFPEWIGIS